MTHTLGARSRQSSGSLWYAARHKHSPILAIKVGMCRIEVNLSAEWRGVGGAGVGACGAVRHGDGAVRCGAVRCGAACGAVCGAVRCGAVCGVVWCVVCGRVYPEGQ